MEIFKKYFKIGDLVFMKGLQEIDQPLMKVLEIVWKKDEDNLPIRVEKDGKLSNVLSGVLCGWFYKDETQSNIWTEKIFDSRDLYIKEDTLDYHLKEAYYIALFNRDEDTVRLLNEIGVNRLNRLAK
jgi:hypothetical protein